MKELKSSPKLINLTVWGLIFILTQCTNPSKEIEIQHLTEPLQTWSLNKLKYSSFNSWIMDTGKYGQRFPLVYSHSDNLFFKLHIDNDEPEVLYKGKNENVKKLNGSIIRYEPPNIWMYEHKDKSIRKYDLKLNRKLTSHYTIKFQDTSYKSFNAHNEPVLYDSVLYFSIFTEGSSFYDPKASLVRKVVKSKNHVYYKDLDIFLPHRNSYAYYGEHHVYLASRNSASFVYGFAHLDTVYLYDNAQLHEYVIPEEYSVDMKPYKAKIPQKGYIEEFHQRQITDPMITDIFVNEKYLVVETRFGLPLRKDNKYLNTYTDKPIVYLKFDLKSSKLLKVFRFDPELEIRYMLDNIMYVSYPFRKMLEQEKYKNIYAYQLP